MVGNLNPELTHHIFHEFLVTPYELNISINGFRYHSAVQRVQSQVGTSFMRKKTFPAHLKRFEVRSTWNSKAISL